MKILSPQNTKEFLNQFPLFLDLASLSRVLLPNRNNRCVK